MAGTYSPTSTLSNLTRLELEALRRADTSAGGKALTVGDSALSPEGVVGRGDPNAERFLTGPALSNEAVYGVVPPPAPGTLLGSTTATAPLVAESVQWYGPTPVLDDLRGAAVTSVVWGTHDPAVDFVAMGVQSGDLIIVQDQPLVSPSGSLNAFGTAVVQTVLGPNQLRCSHITNPLNGAGPVLWNVDGNEYSYVIVRPAAVQLFAVPGSGPVGREQSFLAVLPGSALHGMSNPTIDQINADRVMDLVGPGYTQDPSVDRADAVFPSPAPRAAATKLGYRIVLYPDDGTGTGPDLTSPILSPSVLLDPAIPVADQRQTIDYRAGVIRFSCAPQAGTKIKPTTGCVNATTGRLNLYAVFWAVDLSLTSGVAQGLWATRGLPGLPRSPGRIRYSTNPAKPAWLIGSTGSTNDLFVDVRDTSEDYRATLRFGTMDPTAGSARDRYFSYYGSASTPTGQRVWKMLARQVGTPTDPLSAHEVEVGDRTAITLGDSSAPPTAPGLYNATTTIGGVNGGRYGNNALTSLFDKLEEGQFSVVHLRRGTHQLVSPVHVPPGVTVEGEGDATIVKATGTAFVFGPNTPRGVWQANDITDFYYEPTTRIEGVDVAWNPVRRVWGTVTADLTTHSLWFNEVGLDGTPRFSGLGVEIKGSATHLFSSSSPNSQDHTTGHYPRVVHSIGTNEYYVVWVEEKTVGPDTGPQVYMQAIRVVEPAEPTASAPQGTQPVPAVVKRWASSVAVVTGITWSNHPSIAVHGEATGSPEYLVTVWAYSSVTPGSYTSSIARVYGQATTPSVNVVAVRTDSVGTAGVVSSTDAVLDSQGTGFQSAWSVRTHSILFGTTGKWTVTGVASPDPGHSYLTDAGVGSFGAKGVVAGSKFMYLGVPLPSTYVTSYLGDAPTTLNLAELPSYGDDGIVYDFDSANPSRPRIKSCRDGQPYPTFTTHVLATSTTGVTTAGGSALSDASVNFITAGVAVGDKIFILSGPNLGEYEVAGSISTHSLVIVGTFPSNDASAAYLLLVGRPFRFAVTPRTYVEGRRSTSLGGAELSKLLLAGGVVPGSASTYEFGEYEPDYVRLGAAEDRFIVVYQNMNTTSRLSKDYMVGEVGILWSPLPPDAFVFLRDYQAPHREHITTSAVLLGWDGTPLDEVRDSIGVNMPEFDEAKGRPMTQIRRSLGTRTLIGARPNFRDIVGTRKDGQQMADEVACRNWLHRWTTSRTPSLLPDVTWNGEDFVVASPSKHEIRSFVGTYTVGNTGIVTLRDATVYFGDGTSYAQASNQGVGRPTLDFGDLIYFPDTNTVAAVADILAPHAVTLTGTDAGLLNLGSSTTTTNIEWVWIKSANSSKGPKHPGFRVTLDGEVLASASYITFAEELGDDAALLAIPPATTLMNRTGGSDRFVDGAWVTSGFPFPAAINYDAPADARHRADIGFRGPAVGRSKGTSYVAQQECSLIALAWGETGYAAVDREVAGGNTSTASVTNRVSVLRQSFGPYHNGLRDMKVEGNPRTALVAGVASPLTLRSQNLVWTRHGTPTGSQGFFATDGHRACFVFAGRQNGFDALALGTFSGINAFENFGHGVFAVYSDPLGLDPVRIEGPRSRLQTQTSPPWYFQDAPFAQEFYSGIVSGVGREVYPNLAAAPRVVWDGSNYAAVWWETATLSSRTPVLRFSFFPGADQPGQPMSETVNLYDVMGQARVAQEIQARVGTGYSVGAVDLATSGRTYAAAWTLGRDTNVSGTNSTGAMVAVTIFSAGVHGSGHVYECEPAPYYGSGNGTSAAGYLGQTFDQDYKYGVVTATTGVNFAGMAAAGDILIVTTGTAIGRYRVTSVSTTSLFLDRWLPSTTFSYTLHKPKLPPGAKTYVLEVSPAIGAQRVNIGSPHVIWDGQRYVVSWRSGGTSESGIKADHLMVATLREDGVGSPSNVVVSHAAESYLSDQPLMLLAPNDSDPTLISFAGRTVATVTSGAGTSGTSIVAPGATNWTTLGLTEGSLVLFGPSGNKQIYVARQVTSTTLTTDRALHISGAQATEGFAFRPMPRVKVGDTLRLARATYDATVTSVPGTLRVLSVLPDLHAILVEEGFPSTSGKDKIGIYGQIVNEGKGDPNATGDGENVIDDALIPSPVVSRQLGRTATDLARIGRVYGIAHMAETGQYVALIGNDSTGSSNAISLVAFDKRALQASRVVPVSAGSTHLISSLGWNGQHLLVVWATDGSPSSTGLRYALYDSQLRQVGQSQVLRGYSDFQGLQPGQTPGDGALSANSNLSPCRIRNVVVRWNGALGRWMVSVSVTTYFDGTPTQATGTNQLPPERQLINTTVTSVSNNVLTLDNGGTNDTNYITPGCQLVFRYNTVALSGAVQPEAMVQVLDVNWSAGVNQATVTLSTPFLPRPATDYLAGDLFLAPREDVFLLTLGYPDPTIQLLDPDGVELRNVTVNGGVDVEERWKYLGRTRWLASGPLLGATLKRRFYPKTNGLLAGDTASPGQRPQWLPVLSRPRPPRIEGMTSRSRNRYGYRPTDTK